VTVRHIVKLTRHFERNLQELEAFLLEAEVPHAFDILLDELADTVIPNLERFPGMGRLFPQGPAHSVEAANGIERLARQLGALARDSELREYVMMDYLLLYAWINETVYLLSIRHQRQLSFDFQGLWMNS